MSFDELGLSPDLARGVADRGYHSPTAIQEQAIPLILDGRDLVAAAQTGTGKTAAFVLPVLQRLAFVGQARAHQVRALVLVPTRELAEQVNECAIAYAQHLTLQCSAIFGGVKIDPQLELMERGVDLLVATPGRLLDLLQRQAVDFSSLEVWVLDEADRMLDMGFIPDIRKIAISLPKNRQTLMFSATYSNEIVALAERYLDSPESVEVAPRNSATDQVEQFAYSVERGQKASLLVHLLREHQWHQALVFTRTKHGANRLACRIAKEGFKVAPIHGNKSQNARRRALQSFRDGELQVLVATDIAARGLDIEFLPHVVNFDLPEVPEDYVHRIGRTGRAGATGRAHTLVSSDDRSLMKAIERLLGRRLPQLVVPGFEPGRNRLASSSDGAHAGPAARRTDKPSNRRSAKRRTQRVSTAARLPARADSNR
ncbi:MAG: DEAD/DEAH box helicase [Pseudomonadota bacterium]